MRSTIAAIAVALALYGCASEYSGPDARSDAPATAPDGGDRDLTGQRDNTAPPVDLSADAATCTLLAAYSSKDVVCNDCAEQRCCAELNACFGATECNDDYVNCILACTLDPIPDAGVSACVDTCGSDHPGGKAKWDVAIGCAEARCVAECG